MESGLCHSFRTDGCLGASYLGDNRCRFTVWAPLAQKADVHVLAPNEHLATLTRNQWGYHQGTLEGVALNSLYYYRLDDAQEYPDPASRHQPQGVHGPSQVVEDVFPWQDPGWAGVLLKDYVIYELHVGTFTPEGTFDAIIPQLNRLKALGVTAVELMPVAQFPGERNWGYDGVGLYAAQNSYGGPEGLRRLVDACHQRGLAVVLDVVYNHLGPEGNYLGSFGPYFTDRYRTPWGAALNFDAAESNEVRRFFIENALYWITDCRIDALRLDAVHAIRDHSARTFIEDLVSVVRNRAEQLNRRVYLIAESAANDVRLIQSQETGGYGADAQWSDDFHHSLHTLLTGESEGYYQDYGAVRHLAKAMQEGFVYSGEYSAYRRRQHGTPSRAIPAQRFVVCAQNHDQVGNRMLGERLSGLISFEALKLAAAVTLLAPFVPLLFMGEEYGESASFPYFISHTDSDLVEAVRGGRREEFAAFQEEGEPPDPQDEQTFLAAKLNLDLLQKEPHRTLLEFYTQLLGLRRETPALAHLSKERLEVVSWESPRCLFLRRWHGQSEVAAVFSFEPAAAKVTVPLPPGKWRTLLNSADQGWRGPGGSVTVELHSEGQLRLELPAHSALLLERRTSSQEA